MTYFNEYLGQTGAFIAAYGPPICGKSSLIGQILSSSDPITKRPYSLYVADMDRQLHVIRNQWGSATPRPPEELERIHPVYVGQRTVIDSSTGAGRPDSEEGWLKLGWLTQRWQDERGDAEPYEEWESDRILWFDGGSQMVYMAFQQVLGSRASGFFANRSGGGKQLILRDPADIGGAQSLVDDIVQSVFTIYPRRFHVVFTFHSAPLSVDLSKSMTDEQIQKKLQEKESGGFQKGKKGDDSRVVTVDTVRQFALLPGKKLARKFFGKFPYVLPIENDLEPCVLTTPTTLFDARIPGQVGKFPPRLSGRTALADILQHHSTLNEEERNECK